MKTPRMLAAPAIAVFVATLLAGCGDPNDDTSDEPTMSEDAMMTEDAMMEDEG